MNPTHPLTVWLQPLRQQASAWLAFLYGIMLLLHGISESDYSDYAVMAQDMTRVLAPQNRQFLYSSPLNFIIGSCFGPPSPFSFYFLHGLEILGMLTLIVHCVQKKLQVVAEQIRFLTLLSFTPLWLITLKWIGKPDPLLIGMLFLCWAYPGRWRLLAVGLMVAAHREMGTAMTLFLFISEDEKDYALALPLLGGFGFHYLYQHYILDRLPFSRTADITVDIWRHPREVVHHPVVYGIASLSWFWLAVLWQRPVWRLTACLAGAFGVAVFSEDFTRDFILMALPPVIFHAETLAKDKNAAVLERFLPLAVLQIQIAAMGGVFKANNVVVDWMMGTLGNQLLK